MRHTYLKQTRGEARIEKIPKDDEGRLQDDKDLKKKRRDEIMGCSILHELPTRSDIAYPN